MSSYRFPEPSRMHLKSTSCELHRQSTNLQACQASLGKITSHSVVFIRHFSPKMWRRKVILVAERFRFWAKQTKVKTPPVCSDGFFIYLEDEHLSPQYSQRVEASVADVWFGVGVGRPVPRGEPRGSRLPVWFAGVRGRMGARKGRRGQSFGGLESLIRRPWRKPELLMLHEAAIHKPSVQ